MNKKSRHCYWGAMTYPLWSLCLHLVSAGVTGVFAPPACLFFNLFSSVCVHSWSPFIGHLKVVIELSWWILMLSIKTASHIAWAGLELPVKPRMTLNSWSTHFHLSTGVKDVHQDTWLGWELGFVPARPAFPPTGLHPQPYYRLTWSVFSLTPWWCVASDSSAWALCACACMFISVQVHVHICACMYLCVWAGKEACCQDRQSEFGP